MAQGTRIEPQIIKDFYCTLLFSTPMPIPSTLLYSTLLYSHTHTHTLLFLKSLRSIFYLRFTSRFTARLRETVPQHINSRTHTHTVHINTHRDRETYERWASSLLSKYLCSCPELNLIWREQQQIRERSGVEPSLPRCQPVARLLRARTASSHS